MTKLGVIGKAWLNVLKGVTTKEHKRRAGICKSCPLAEHSVILDFVKDELVEVKGLLCSDCGCPLSAKIRSTDKCNKW